MGGIICFHTHASSSSSTPPLPLKTRKKDPYTPINKLPHLKTRAFVYKKRIFAYNIYEGDIMKQQTQAHSHSHSHDYTRAISIDTFVKTYVETRDIHEASMSIELTDSQGKALLTIPEVKDKITALQSTPDYILANIKRVADVALCNTPLPRSTTSDPSTSEPSTSSSQSSTPIYDYDPALALKALELLGKNKKLFTDRVESLSVQTPFEEYIKRVEDDEEF